MRIGFIVNDVQTEEAKFTTIRLAMAAHNLEHEVWLTGTGELDYDPDENIYARARAAPNERYKSEETYLHDLQGDEARIGRIRVSSLDVVLLRNDPSIETGDRSWARSAGVIFGRAAMGGGVIVLNDPNELGRAQNKMYFQSFPEEVRPRTLITRDRVEIREFAKEHGGRIVLKPLLGSGGANVFVVQRDDMANLNQMIDAVSRDGYVIAQEYLPAAAEGDIRLFVMNGQPLKYKGKYCAFRRLRSEEDARSNATAGGSVVEAEIDETALRVAEIVRPKLVMDGMFLVGLDIVGDKLMEINVFSPGGLGNAHKMTGMRFERPVIDALDRKVQYARYYRRNFSNVEMATL